MSAAVGSAAGLTSLSAQDVAAVPAPVLAAIRGGRRVLTVCHEKPESDALGSALATALIVEQLGGRATPVCSDPVPEMYSFMPHIERFRQDPEPEMDYDLIVVGDCGDLQRVGSVLTRHAELFGRVPILNIDHHVSNTGFGAVDWIDPTAAATCEQVTLLAAALELPMDAAEGAIAANLMAGVVIDTANFQHPNTTPRTLRVAAELVSAGAPLHETARRLYRTKPNRQLVLFGRVLNRLQEDLEGRLVWTSLHDSDLDETGAMPDEAEGLSDLISQSESAALAVLFKQDSSRSTRISVRTREGGLDATALTGLFGGGGHARAAGATVPLPLAEAEEAVLAAARQLVEAAE
ncbi:MAG TPA: DHH family phosphoesterase [Candidatus Limnocylindrales bacterium]|nr:DHH family phosphoesterase [Candidatus Limnocylindrales bacterium]